MEVVPVKLTPAEYHHAAHAGFIRQFNNVINHVKPKSGGADEAEGFDNHIIGALGEYAFAKAYNFPWPGPGEIGAKDVAGYQVRATDKGWGGLIVRPRDKDHDVYVLVTGFGLDFVIRGWMICGEAKIKGEKRVNKEDDTDIYFLVKQRDLNPMKHLPRVAK